jgi:hypothetical protein
MPPRTPQKAQCCGSTLRLFALKVYDDSRAVLEAETGRTGVEQIRWSTPVKWTVSHLNSVRSQTPAGSFLPRRAAFYVFEDEGLKRINIVGRYVYMPPPTPAYLGGTLMTVF